MCIRDSNQGANAGIFRVLGNVGVKALLVANCRRPRTGDNHRLGLAIETMCDVLAEVLDDELHLLGDIRRVQGHPLR